jgi:hypothetical protein
MMKRLATFLLCIGVASMLLIPFARIGPCGPSSMLGLFCLFGVLALPFGAALLLAEGVAHMVRRLAE